MSVPVGGFDGGGGVFPVPVTDNTIVLITKPIAVSILAIVIPCSLNKVFILSTSVVSSFKIVLIVCLILDICDANSFLFVT